jgi:hemerythrin
MYELEWNNLLSVGIEEIDEQHKNLIALINKAIRVLPDTSGKKESLEIVEGLLEYAEVHFKTEEKYFKQFNYPKAEKHIKIHKQFVSEVLDFKMRLDKGEKISYLLLNYVEEWFEKHLLDEDMKYKIYFEKKLAEKQDKPK